MGAVADAYMRVQDELAELTGLDAGEVVPLSDTYALVAGWVAFGASGRWELEPMTATDARNLLDAIDGAGVDDLIAARIARSVMHMQSRSATV